MSTACHLCIFAATCVTPNLLAYFCLMWIWRRVEREQAIVETRPEPSNRKELPDPPPG